MISKANGVAQTKDFVYKDFDGADRITVYVFDSGCNSKHNVNPLSSSYFLELQTLILTGEKQDFTQRNPALISDYIFAAPPNTKTDAISHGTCVFSKSSGQLFGVAKDANVIIVKNGKAKLDISLGIVLNGFGLIIEDIKKNNRQGKAVVNFSAGFPKATIDDPADADNKAKFRAALDELVNQLNVPVVTTAGNVSFFCC
jgi:hypothetical protein